MAIVKEMTKSNREILLEAIERWPSTFLGADTIAYHDENTVVLISPDHCCYVSLSKPTTPSAVSKAQKAMEDAGLLVRLPIGDKQLD